MGWKISSVHDVDPKRHVANTVVFELRPTGAEGEFQVEDLGDIHFGPGIANLPTPESVKIRTLSDGRYEIEIELFSRFGSKGTTRVVLLLTGLSLIITAFVGISSAQNQVSIAPLLIIMVTFVVILIGLGVHLTKRGSWKLANYLAHAAHLRIADMSSFHSKHDE
jgi:hypothetical protein